MDCTATRLTYRKTGAFSKIILDYIEQSKAVESFYLSSPNIEGIKKSIEARKLFNTPRATLVTELHKQYRMLETSEATKNNIKSLAENTSFTITTAHQNNIFSGPLYFIYKILHVIKLARRLERELPENHFVPVFYMGSEDADLEELNHIFLNGEKLVWETKQTGAVGRMQIDESLLKLINRMEGQLSGLPFGKEILNILKDSYKEGETLQVATFRFLNSLFAEYGLVVLLPDNAELKKQMIPIFEDELRHQSASAVVEQTAAALQQLHYKTQAHPREINLFYLSDGLRGRIEKLNDTYYVHDAPDLKFNEKEILEELQTYPERFSPNVILRGLYQETILPNIAFIGGGGETAYWLELKSLFEKFKVPYPVLILRNSFLFIEKKWQEKIRKLGFGIDDIFLPEMELLNRLVQRDTDNTLQLNGTLSATEALYDTIRAQASSVDQTLDRHVLALKLRAIDKLKELEKKMLKAEKRKFGVQQQQIKALKQQLFPGNGLQERKENISLYYAQWGKDFIAELLKHSLTFEQEFLVLQE